MSAFTAAELVDAVKVTNDGPFPLVEDPETVRILSEAIRPAMLDLPSHHDCEVVRLALQTMFVMGLAAGIELGRRA